jgi:hypothetical protein
MDSTSALREWLAGETIDVRTVNAGRPEDVTLIPFYRFYNQRYCVYWRFRSASKV